MEKHINLELNQRFEAAVRKQNLKLIEYYLNNKVNPNTRYENNDTVLHMCAEKNLCIAIEMLLKRPPITIDIGNDFGMTPLNIAATYGSTDAAQLLLNHGASVRIANKMLNTPLHLAVMQSHVAIVNLLLDHEADPNAFNAFYITPLALSVNQNINYQIAEILLKKGGDSNFYNKKHTMPLLLECCLFCHSNEHLQIIELLIKYGTDVNAVTHFANKSGLHVAAMMGNIDLIKLLLEHGAKRNIENVEGINPYEMAIRHGNMDAAAILRPNSDHNIFANN